MALLFRGAPAALTSSPLERVRAGIGALLGIIVTGLAATLWLVTDAGPLLLIAPMGASAILLFGVPASPLAQPWPMIGGNVVAAVIGVTAEQWIGAPLLAASAAVGCTMVAMSLLRCIHLAMPRGRRRSSPAIRRPAERRGRADRRAGRPSQHDARVRLRARAPSP